MSEAHIIIAACKDECTRNLSEKAKLWFCNFGGSEIQNLKYREGFAFISGDGNGIGKRSKSKFVPVEISKKFQFSAKMLAKK